MLKSVKIDGLVLERVRALPGSSLSKKIELLLGGLLPRTDLDVVLDQLKLINVRLDEMDGRLGLPVESAVVSSFDVQVPESEVPSDPDWLRRKREQEELARRQRYAVDHPEDSDQSGGW